MRDRTMPVGMIGVGHMGAAIARRLAGAGTGILAFDVSAEALRGCSGPGLEAAGSVREVADRAEVMLVCLSGPEASLAVAREAAGGTALRHYVEMSTLPPATMEALAGVFAGTGIGLCDAPLSGGPRVVAEGRSALMLSGDPATTAVAGEVLAPVAGRTFLVGERPGAAQICKLVNNAISMSTVMLASEAITAGVKAGIDAAVLVDVINAGSGMSRTTLEKFPGHVLNRRFAFGGRLGMVPKDLGAYLDEAQRLGVPSPLVTLAEQLYRQAIDAVGAEADLTAAVKLFEGWAGVEVGRAPDG